MRHARVMEIVSHIRYKPRWQFFVEPSGDIEIVAHVPDAYHPGLMPVDPPHAYVIDTDKIKGRSATDVLVGKIFDACRRLEFHEASEWFMYRGRRVFDPHK